MAIRIVYLLDGKGPDIVENAKKWTFGEDTVSLWGENDANGPLIELQRNAVLALEQVDSAPEPVEEPEKAEEAEEE